jgi:hypothetical protein
MKARNFGDRENQGANGGKVVLATPARRVHTK